MSLTLISRGWGSASTPRPINPLFLLHYIHSPHWLISVAQLGLQNKECGLFANQWIKLSAYALKHARRSRHCGTPVWEFEMCCSPSVTSNSSPGSCLEQGVLINSPAEGITPHSDLAEPLFIYFICHLFAWVNPGGMESSLPRERWLFPQGHRNSATSCCRFHFPALCNSHETEPRPHSLWCVLPKHRAVRTSPVFGFWW